MEPQQWIVVVMIVLAALVVLRHYRRSWHGAVLLELTSGLVLQPSEDDDGAIGWTIEPDERIRRFVITGIRQAVIIKIQLSLLEKSPPHVYDGGVVHHRRIKFDLARSHRQIFITPREHPPNYDRLWGFSLEIDTPGLDSIFSSHRQCVLDPEWFEVLIRQPVDIPNLHESCEMSG